MLIIATKQRMKYFLWTGSEIISLNPESEFIEELTVISALGFINISNAVFSSF